MNEVENSRQFHYVVPLIPESLNKYAGRQNAWQYREDKQNWLNIMAVYCRQKPISPIQKAIVTLTYFFADKSRRDPDNYCGKMILDGLVKCRVLQDDSFEHIELRICGGYDKRNPRTEITVLEDM